MKSNKILNIISIILALVLIFFAINYSSKNNSGNKVEEPINNVSIVDGKQIIEIKAKGGYTPRKNIAKAGIPTIIRFNTKATFDCSSAVYVPSKKISVNLPATGSTDLDIGVMGEGVLEVTCGMGMYSFAIDFVE
jgi:plastocyanin domain-containing protein